MLAKNHPGFFILSNGMRVNPETGDPEAFVSNKQPGPASYQGKAGEG
ncbi:MAG: hypothetical protein M3512_18045 [Bacteroidota bacterium]|nr:hypothetical protein [Bacteroidota bacterium]